FSRDWSSDVCSSDLTSVVSYTRYWWYSFVRRHILIRSFTNQPFKVIFIQHLFLQQLFCQCCQLVQVFTQKFLCSCILFRYKFTRSEERRVGIVWGSG